MTSTTVKDTTSLFLAGDAGPEEVPETVVFAQLDSALRARIHVAAWAEDRGSPPVPRSPWTHSTGIITATLLAVLLVSQRRIRAARRPEAPLSETLVAETLAGAPTLPKGETDETDWRDRLRLSTARDRALRRPLHLPPHVVDALRRIRNESESTRSKNRSSAPSPPTREKSPSPGVDLVIRD